MLRFISIKLRTVIFDSSFVLSVLFTFLLCTSAIVYTDRLNYNDYSAFTALLNFSRSMMLDEYDFSSIAVLRQCGTGWLTLFFPIAAPFAWTKVFSASRNTGFIRFELQRKSRFSYNIGEYLSGCISAGISSLFGFLLFAIFVYLLYPNIRMYDAASQAQLYEFHAMVYEHSASLEYSKVLIFLSSKMFLYGFFSATLVLLFAGISDSFYTLLCIPFFLTYAWGQIITKLLAEAKYTNLTAFLASIKPGGILLSDMPIYQACFPHMFFMLISFVLFASSLNYRRKTGENV